MKLSEHISIGIRSFRWMFCNERKYTLYLISHSVLTAVVSYVPLYYSAKIIDALFAGESIQRIIMYVILTVGLTFLINLLAGYIQPRMDTAHNRAYMDEEWRYSEKAMEMAYESIEDRDVALLRDRIKKESQTGFNLFYLHRTTKNFIYTITQIICSLVMTLSFFLNPLIYIWFKVGIVGLLIATIVVESFCTIKSMNITNAFWNGCVFLNLISEKYNNYISDYGAGKDVRLYGMSDSLVKNFEAFDNEQYRNNRRCSVGWTKANLPRVIMLEILKFTTNLFLIFAAVSGAVSVGSISKYVSSIVKLLWAIAKLVQDMQLAFSNHEYLKRYFSYFDIPNNMYQGTLTVEKRDDAEYYVEFRNVSFKYPGSESYALHNVNVKFKVGEKIAVVGLNGSGKTTFIKLMCRLYDPTEGEILLNGVNIKKYDYDEYMSIFSVVFQDFSLFAFSLGQNVAASQKFEEQKVCECLKKAGFEDRLKTLSNGTETFLYKNYDQNGVEISGGEAQKIALARALYKDAPFIVLDEPTAALDPVSEYEVYSKFNEIAGDKTAIYISHRLASCRFCDRIAVFHEGAIIQQGSHEELLADDSGKYYELWNAQAQYYIPKCSPFA